MDPIQHLCFRDVAWLQHSALTKDTVLDYLALSPFWDGTCTNELLKMQLRHGTEPTLHTVEVLQQRLELMTSGVEFVLSSWSSDGRQFVVHKRQRVKPGAGQHCTVLLGIVYVVDGNAFQAPSVGEVVRGRLTSCLQHLIDALEYGRGRMIDTVMSSVASSTALVHPSESIEAAQMNALNASFLAKIM